MRLHQKFQARIIASRQISPLQKFGLGALLSALVGTIPLLRFLVCLLRSSATVQVTLLLLARLERSRTRARYMCGGWTHLLDSDCMMGTLVVGDDLLGDLPSSIFSCYFESTSTLCLRSIPAPRSRLEVLRFLDGFNTLFVWRKIFFSLVTKRRMKSHNVAMMD